MSNRFSKMETRVNRLEINPDKEFMFYGSGALEKEEFRKYFNNNISYSGLSGAALPMPEVNFIFKEGFRRGVYVDTETNEQIKEIEIAVSTSKLFGLFIELVNELGPRLTVHIEHDKEKSPASFYRCEYSKEGIEKAELLGALRDFEDLLIFDGYLSISIFTYDAQGEQKQNSGAVLLDEHKVISIAGCVLDVAERILARQCIEEDPTLCVVSDTAHFHFSSGKLEAMAGEIIQKLELSAHGRS